MPYDYCGFRTGATPSVPPVPRRAGAPTAGLILPVAAAMMPLPSPPGRDGGDRTPPVGRRTEDGIMNKWVLAGILVAVAVFMYLSIIVKMSG